MHKRTHASMHARALFLVAAVLLPGAAAEVRVIINQDAGVATASPSDLEDLYLGRKSKWPSGVKAVVLTNAATEETRRFLSRFLDRTPASFSAEWKRIVFTGKGSAPAEAKDDQEMIELVRKTVGAVGYVSAEAITDGKTEGNTDGKTDGVIVVAEPK